MTIEEIKQALEAATPLPWETFGETRPRPLICSDGAVDYDNENVAGIIACTEGPNAERAPNARLIVEAVNNLPKFLKAVEAARTLHVVCQTLMNSDSEDEHVTLDEIDAYDEASDALRKALEAFK
jgi:hypothetical protein